MKILLYKVIRELFQDRSRTISAFIAMSLGIIGFGSLLITYSIIARDLPQMHKLTKAHSLILHIDSLEPVNDRVESILNQSNAISGYEIRGHHQLRVRGNSSNSRSMDLYSFADLKNHSINQTPLEEGRFAGDNKEIMFERRSFPFLGVKVGESVFLGSSGEFNQDFKAVGTVHDISVDPANYHGEIYGYTTIAGMRELGLQPNQVTILVTGDPYSRDNIVSKSEIIVNELEAAGIRGVYVDIPYNPGASPHQHEYGPVTSVLQVIGIIIYILAFLLIVNLLNTILSRQTKQIGIIKAIGGKTITIFFVYLFMVLFFISGSVVVSIPASIWIGKYLTSFFLSLGNYNMVNPSIPILTLTILVSSCFLLPVGVCFLPILRNCRIPVKQALNDYGVGSSIQHRGLLFRMLNKFAFFNQPVKMAIRNISRNIGRITAAVVILAVGGIIFMSAMHTISSFKRTVSSAREAYNYQYELRAAFQDASQTGTPDLKEVLETGNDIRKYEIWGLITGTLVMKDGKSEKQYSIQIPAINSTLYIPQLQNGRWFNENDVNGIVLSNQFLNTNYHYLPGETISFTVDNQQFDFPILGIVDELGEPAIYLSPAFTALHKNSVKIEPVAKIVLKNLNNGAAGMQVNRIEKHFEESGYQILYSKLSTEHIEITEKTSADIMGFFLNAAILIIIVGGIGLASTMSIQVMDRTKEIGILKSIGADNRLIYQIILSESLTVAALSLLFSIILSFPVSLLSNWLFGKMFFNVNLITVFTIQPYMLWAVYLTLITILSSVIPAKTASGIDVKNALAYE